MRGYLIGILIGAALMFSASAFADDIKSLVGLEIQGEFPVAVNGKILDAKAEVINGSSFLPVRAISDAVGYDTQFDASTGIQLTKKEISKVDTNQETIVITNTPPTPLPMTLDQINKQIDALKLVILLEKQAIMDYTAEKAKPNLEAIAKQQAQIDDLEKQKAALTAGQ